MEYRPGEKILVKNRDSEDWVFRWYVSDHPFRCKVVTVDTLGVLEEWFKSNSIKNENS